MEQLVDLGELFRQHPAACVALSGGLDSTALLHLVAVQRPPAYPLRALHVNHQLQAEADDWTRHCAKLCDSLDIPFASVHVDVAVAPGESPEAAARDARRDAFAKHLLPNEALLLAQHANDQAETFLLMALRGSGLPGLSAMASVQPFADGTLCRPLLSITRAQLREYAVRHALQWIEDPSNQSLDFDRNYLRHEVMPRLSERWPAAVDTLGRSARRAAEADELLDELASMDLAVAQGQGGALEMAALRELSPARCRNLLRHWVAEQALPAPSEAQLQRVLDEVLPARRDAECLVHWPGAELRSYRDRLYAMPPLSPMPEVEHRWPDLSQPLLLPELGRTLELVELERAGLRIPPGGEVTVSYRRGGETLRVACGGRTRPLKKCLQEAGLPPWQRDRVPLIHIDGQLAAALGVAISADFAAKQ